MINFLHHHNYHCQFCSLSEKQQDILNMHNKRENTHALAMEPSRWFRYFVAIEPARAYGSVACELRNHQLLMVP